MLITSAAKAGLLNEQTSLLLNLPSAVKSINKWASQVSVNGHGYIYGTLETNKEFQLDVRRVFKFGFPPYTRIFIINHLDSDNAYWWNEDLNQGIAKTRSTEEIIRPTLKDK
jgi:hypothetical protein